MFKRLILLAFCLVAVRDIHAEAASTEIWFGMTDLKTPAGRKNWDKIFLDPTATWPESLSSVNVIIATQQSLSRLPDDDLAKVITRLRQHHIGLDVAVLAQNWANEAKCGYNVEGYSNPGVNAELVAKLQRAHAQVSYIGMDEPLFFGHYYDGENACHSSIPNVAERVSAILREYLKVYPNATIIDTEPFPAISNHLSWRDDYKNWLEAFRSAVGRPIGGMNIDLNWPPRWQQTLASAVAFAREMRLSVGIFYWANPKIERGSAITNESWLENTVQNFIEVEQGMKTVPDRAIFTSWSKFPERAITDSSGAGEDYLVEQYVLMKNRH